MSEISGCLRLADFNGSLVTSAAVGKTFAVEYGTIDSFGGNYTIAVRFDSFFSLM